MEEAVKKKLQNWWWYHRHYVLLAALVLTAGLYVFLSNAGEPEPDYCAALVSAVSYPQEELDALADALAAFGEDRNGDGRVLVEIRQYTVDLADGSQNAGVKNYQTVAALDADLVGRVSGLFLLEDPEAFRRSAEQVFQEDAAIPWRQVSPAGPEGLTLALRRDPQDEEAYRALWDRLPAFAR